MATPIKNEFGTNLWELTHESLVLEYAHFRDKIAEQQKYLGHIDQEIHARMDAASATALTNDDGEILVKRTPAKPEYDQGLLVALKEVPGFAGDAYKESWVEEWTKETVVVAHWDMVKLNKWSRTIGKPVQDILNRARLPEQRGKLKFIEEGAGNSSLPQL